jgi:E3 ubiquitin-protein ligase SHPRH
VQGRIRTAGKATGRALAALTALRQSCCHPQIVRRTEEALGKERKSMRDIMSSLVRFRLGGEGTRVEPDQDLLAGQVQGTASSRAGAPAVPAQLLCCAACLPPQVVKAYSEWDQAARRLLDARLIAAAVEAGVGSHPGVPPAAVVALLFCCSRHPAGALCHERCPASKFL